ncbi:hypothetical protein GCM10011515_14120 [Tsuneonella deserti]|uniref:Uncharacterized protein n=1 Tax=Tsuneonella deserti TaxID=2035528 RepID=A0ABQ1S821_9SPHN|nr:hypothetical protein GCM10011515_14120 [Tsuneonella deserti]
MMPVSLRDRSTRPIALSRLREAFWTQEVKDGFAVTVISGCLAGADAAMHAAAAAKTNLFMVAVPFARPKNGADQRVERLVRPL